MVMRDLTDKVSIITGSASGIGRAIAMRFAAEGAVVIVADVNVEGADVTVDAIAKANGRAHAVAVDLRDPTDIKRAVGDVLAEHGRIDVLCNNAGVMDALRPPLEVSLELWELVMAVNATAPFLLTQAVLPGMIAQGSGSIVNIASIAGIAGGRAGTAYTVSKHALVGLTRSVAFTHLEDGIRCNAICPGGITTGIASRDDPRDDFGAVRYRLAHAMKPRHGDPAEIAKAAVFLASDEASFVNGVIMPVDGGWTAG
jgi:NAD(P)-dependent dehydrogenase (short-subunit alcohol dehydrogenase family)